jgi:hypothetical protein
MSVESGSWFTRNCKPVLKGFHRVVNIEFHKILVTTYGEKNLFLHKFLFITIINKTR